jgi:hypothetical protein
VNRCRGGRTSLTHGSYHLLNAYTSYTYTFCTQCATHSKQVHHTTLPQGSSCRLSHNPRARSRASLSQPERNDYVICM